MLVRTITHDSPRSERWRALSRIHEHCTSWSEHLCSWAWMAVHTAWASSRLHFHWHYWTHCPPPACCPHHLTLSSTLMSTLVVPLRWPCFFSNRDHASCERGGKVQHKCDRLHIYARQSHGEQFHGARWDDSTMKYNVSSSEAWDITTPVRVSWLPLSVEDAWQKLHKTIFVGVHVRLLITTEG